eukprot:TRINITY_DN1666_c0_g1_i1.p1 TRINITY_DN1666_c0_g1~~TRINITY_DN1666_c0_g1_i1.p1  ORF type:complete len:428 (+),score=79.75 TRINITY_DN1666_c0_g1_i1:52-1284(+)
MRPTTWLLGVLTVLTRPAAGLNNGVALEPPMGWCSWNYYHRDFNETVFRNVADAMASNGMQAAGYEYINVDGGWWNGSDTGHIERNAGGYMSYNPAKYPSGILSTIQYIKSKGFKYGHYTDAGVAACNKDAPMSEGFETQDSTLFVNDWGIDMLKLDACNTQEPAETLVGRWEKLLNSTGRKVLFSNCHNGCQTSLGPLPSWCSQLSNMWRVSADIKSTWQSVMNNLEQVVGRGGFAGPGAWNDPDFLEVGVGDFEYIPWVKETSAMNVAHFSMWCIVSAPLIASPPLDNVPQDIINILTNKDAIAVNKAYVNNAGDLLTKTPTGGQIWAKPLPNSQAAVAFLNPFEPPAGLQSFSLPLSTVPNLNATQSSNCTVFDIWTKQVTYAVGTLTASNIGTQSVWFVKISNCTH